MAAISLLAPVPAALSATAVPTGRDLEFRSEFGLDTTGANALSVAGRDPSPNWGVPLTDAEEADLADRVRIENGLPALRAAVESDPGFGGLFIDQEAGGVLDIAATADSEASIRAMADSLAPSGAKVRVRVVTNSMASLKNLKGEVREEMLGSTPLGQQINLLRVDVRANTVVAGVDKSNYTSTVQALEDKFAGRPIRYEPADRLESAACNSRDDVCLPLRAGIAINVAGEVCTSNAVVFAGTNYFLMTAGHCGSVGDNVIHHGLSIGNVTKSAFHNNTYADAMIIDIDNAQKSNLLYVTSTTQRPITSRMPLNGDVVGSAVCGSGIKTMFFCGSVTDTDADGLAPGNIVILSLQICTVDVRQGDSGGPMFYGNKLMGVTSLVNGTHHKTASDEWWENLMFSQIRDAEIQLGVSTYLG